MERLAAIILLSVSPRLRIAALLLTKQPLLAGHVDEAVEIVFREWLTELRFERRANRSGILCGIDEALTLLKDVLPEDNREVWALKDGEPVKAKEVTLRITAPYQSYGLYETALCGILAHSTG